CPPEGSTQVIKKELADMMHQYRDHLNAAETLMDGVDQNNEPASKNLPEAVRHVNEVVNCSAYVAAHAGDQMEAPSIKDLPKDQQTAALEDYKTSTAKFHDLVKIYRDDLMVYQQTTTHPNFEKADDALTDVRDFANEAHRKF